MTKELNNHKESYEESRLIRFKQWLLDKDICKSTRSAGSYSSRLKNALKPMCKELNKEICYPIEFIDSVLIFDKEKGLKLLYALTRLAYQKGKNKKNSKTGTWSDCRTALNRYISFCQEEEIHGNVQKYDKEINIDKFTENWEPCTIEKKVLRNKILKRRKSEGRYTGDVYYPIELIIKIFHNSNDHDKKFIDNWFSKNINKIKLLIDKECNSKPFEELRTLTLCDDYTVSLNFKNSDSEVKLYTRLENDHATLMKVGNIANIHIDHTIAISNLLNPNQLNHDYNYPAFKKLTEMINSVNNNNWEEMEVNKKKTYLKNTFYKENEDELKNMIPSLKCDLEKLLDKVKYEMMDGLANIKKSNKKNSVH